MMKDTILRIKSIEARLAMITKAVGGQDARIAALEGKDPLPERDRSGDENDLTEEVDKALAASPGEPLSGMVNEVIPPNT